MILGVLKEHENEHRVSLLPEAVASLIKQNVAVWVENNAGAKAFAADGLYQDAGAEIKSRREILTQADMILIIHNISNEEIVSLKSGSVLLGTFQPLFNYAVMKFWAEHNVTSFSMDMLPRTTRAQTMDVLSSQASIAGYKAVVLAASVYPHYFPMLSTSAGSVFPAKVLILGAGVAGLQAIATAKRLGAVVEVFDTRPAVKEEVQSLGAKFIEVEGAADASKAGGYGVEQTEEYKERQRQKIADAIAKADVVITTAQIPGKKAPILITKHMLERMKSGSVVIDLAASTGGNCELTKNNATVHFNHISIIGNSNLASSVPYDASKLYGKNVINFMKLIMDENGKLHLNFEDDLVKGTCITHAGNITNERVKELAISNNGHSVLV